MKSVVISIVIAAIVVAGSLIYTSSLERVSSELMTINEEVSKYLEQEDYSGAESEIEHLKSYLNSRRAVLDAIGNHEEMDKIEMSLYELEEYAKGEKQTDALSKCHVLDFLFEHLPLNYKLKPENIL